MKLTSIAIALIAASSVLAANTSAMAFPQGPKDLQAKPQPKFPGPKGPGDFKNPPKGNGPHNHDHSFNPAFGIILGVGAIAAAAAAADAAQDDTVCWKEKHKGQVVLICEE
ncbi:hypothetical protein IZ6_05980 [Terrihabitans soli]|uniref:Uncharacterized protein n=1 Tax=Terrihabitans soli TaxID=708113 RepID=A0A6S6QFJ1_9HYPH|nr:hypothetical protein [Terrihabitans soli]BCJ89863.1 hypothetical protein IZ6_05980 [Terrihabitans soli]